HARVRQAHARLRPPAPARRRAPGQARSRRRVAPLSGWTDPALERGHAGRRRRGGPGRHRRRHRWRGVGRTGGHDGRPHRVGRLGFQTRVQDGGDWDVMVPVFRLDVAIPEDVVEEVGRIYGVDRIPPTLPGRRHESWTPAPTSRPQESIRQVLAGAGFAEAVTPALVSSALLEKLGLAGRMRRLLNPMSEELDAMRTSLLPSLLQVARLNQNRGRPQVRLFELARVYLAPTQDPSGLAHDPLTVAALAHTGGTPAAGREGFLLLKAVTDRLAHALSLPAPAYERATDALFHPGRTAAILLDGARVGL